MLQCKRLSNLIPISRLKEVFCPPDVLCQAFVDPYGHFHFTFLFWPFLWLLLSSVWTMGSKPNRHLLVISLLFSKKATRCMYRCLTSTIGMWTSSFSRSVSCSGKSSMHVHAVLTKHSFFTLATLSFRKTRILKFPVNLIQVEPPSVLRITLQNFFSTELSY